MLNAHIFVTIHLALCNFFEEGLNLVSYMSDFQELNTTHMSFSAFHSRNIGVIVLLHSRRASMVYESANYNSKPESVIRIE